MSDKFSLDDVIDPGEAVEQTKNLIPWLENPHQCDCGAYCDATVEFVEEQAMYTKVWVCPREECEKRYYRARE